MLDPTHYPAVGFYQAPDSEAPRLEGHPEGCPPRSRSCGARIRGGGVEYLHPVRTNSPAEAGNLPVTASATRVAGRHVTDMFTQAVLSRKPLERTQSSNVCCYTPDTVPGRHDFITHPNPPAGETVCCSVMDSRHLSCRVTMPHRLSTNTGSVLCRQHSHCKQQIHSGRAAGHNRGL
jgi:hypothetical protein